MEEDRIKALADALVAARCDLVPVPRVLELDKIAAAKVREATLRSLSGNGRRPILGYKVSVSGSWGALFEDDIHPSPAKLPRAQFFEPLIETEAVFWIEAAITPDMDLPAVLARCSVGVGIELADSRFEDWLPGDAARLVMPRSADTEADNGFASAVVVNSIRIPAENFALAQLRVAALRDGEEIASGRLDYIFGHPAQAVLWLAQSLSESGRQLSPGQFVFCGNPYPDFITIPRGETGRFEAVIDEIGRAILVLE